jgi:hypothetical protein
MHRSEVSGKGELAKRGLLSLRSVPVLLPGLGVKGDEHEGRGGADKECRITRSFSGKVKGCIEDLIFLSP